MRGGLILMFIALLLIYGCKSENTGSAIVDVNKEIEKQGIPDEKVISVNNTNQSYYVNTTIDYSKEAKMRINDAKEEISKTVILLKIKVDKKLINSRNKQKADKLINNAEILLSKAEESYNKGLYENSIDLAVEAKIKSIEAKSVIG
ncbi:hypothetical protein J4455_05350 [Candidatus Woesearchaeota archaeon]|nr:hypothetical protein [Candidatus Woesearchaeota archaeon]